MEGRDACAASIRTPDGRYGYARRADAHADEGGDAQPPDRDRAVSRARRPARAARSATRARPAAARSRRPGSPASRCRNLRIPALRAAVGGHGRRQARPHRLARSRSCSRARSARRRSTTNSAARTWPAISAPSSRRSAGEVRGYHKPIMIAGGVGNIRAAHAHKAADARRARCSIQLGGPGMLIGLGGGAASSMATGANTADLDFDSVQRGNAEIQRRAQEVIDRCWQLGEREPDPVDPRRRRGRAVERAAGAGARRRRAAARFDLRAVPSEEPGMSPREIWCNEAQERYVLAIAPGRPRRASARSASASAARSRWSARRPTTSGWWCAIRIFGNTPVDMDLDVLLGKPPKMTRDVRARRAARCRRSTLAGDRRSSEAVLPRAAAAGGRRQDVPHHHRRPHRRRPVRARPDGRAVAGAGGRRAR